MATTASELEESPCCAQNCATLNRDLKNFDILLGHVNRLRAPSSGQNADELPDGDASVSEGPEVDYALGSCCVRESTGRRRIFPACPQSFPSYLGRIFLTRGRLDDRDVTKLKDGLDLIDNPPPFSTEYKFAGFVDNACRINGLMVKAIAKEIVVESDSRSYRLSDRRLVQITGPAAAEVCVSGDFGMTLRNGWKRVHPSSFC